MLKSQNISTTVADARFCKPLDADLIKRLAKEHEVLITVEEGSIGGFGSHVAHFLCLTGLLDGPLKVNSLPHNFLLNFNDIRASTAFWLCSIGRIILSLNIVLYIKYKIHISSTKFIIIHTTYVRVHLEPVPNG